MRREAADVDAYLAEVPDVRRPALERLREMCVADLDGYEESMDYGMPSYRRAGEEIEVAFASQARHISVYVMRKAVLDAYRDRLTTKNIGKGCVRYANPDRIDFEILHEVLVASASDDGPVC